ncbi:MAG: hypothetical protein HKN23_15410, partial [Verrucomicrobiales bacterium]|nr:hypothetical protein [Verrucomicrobiales bacterium]
MITRFRILSICTLGLAVIWFIASSFDIDRLPRYVGQEFQREIFQASGPAMGALICSVVLTFCGILSGLLFVRWSKWLLISGFLLSVFSNFGLGFYAETPLSRLFGLTFYVLLGCVIASLFHPRIEERLNRKTAVWLHCLCGLIVTAGVAGSVMLGFVMAQLGSMMADATPINLPEKLK